MRVALADNKGQSEYTPPVDLRRFVSVLFSEECAGRPYRAQKLCKVNRQKFYYHLAKSPEFVKWFSAQRAKYRSSMSVLVDNALMAAIASGDVSAIRTFYEMEGSIKKGGIGNGKNGNQVVQVIVKFPEEVEAEKLLSTTDMSGGLQRKEQNSGVVDSRIKISVDKSVSDGSDVKLQ